MKFKRVYKLFPVLLLAAVLLAAGVWGNGGISRLMDAARPLPDIAPLPVPEGDLEAASVIPLPDVYEEGKGFTCTGLAYDAGDDTFFVGDIGILLPGGTIQSRIHRVTPDFRTIKETILLDPVFSDMGDVQGIAIDPGDGTIWLCAPSANRIFHMTAAGESLGEIPTKGPTGIACASADDTLWVLTYANQIIHMRKSGKVLATYDFAYSDTLDQCFLDEGRGYLYITAGANYAGRNPIYLFNTRTHAQSVIGTVDSCSVEGIWIGEERMVIVNDGYYHSAADPRNVANVYALEGSAPAP